MHLITESPILQSTAPELQAMSTYGQPDVYQRLILQTARPTYIAGVTSAMGGEWLGGKGWNGVQFMLVEVVSSAPHALARRHHQRR